MLQPLSFLPQEFAPIGTKITRDCVAILSSSPPLPSLPVSAGEDGRGAWLRNYNDCVRVAGQFRYGNSGADCLFIGCPTRFVLSTISGSGFRQETIFPSFHFLMEFVYRVRQIIYIGDVFFFGHHVVENS